MTSSIIIFIIKQRSVHCYSSQSHEWGEKSNFFKEENFPELYSLKSWHTYPYFWGNAHINVAEHADLTWRKRIWKQPPLCPLLQVVLDQSCKIWKKIYVLSKKYTLSFSSLYGTRTTDNQENIFFKWYFSLAFAIPHLIVLNRSY
jgi:hypothetical protein